MFPAPETAVLMLLAAVVLDWLVGEYPAPVHPVVWIGSFINLWLRLAPRAGWWRQFLFGALFTLLTVTTSVGLALLAMEFTAPLPWLQIVVGILLLKASFALRELGRAADRVIRPVENGDIAAARAALRSLCSRDPSALGPEDLLAGTVQSLAENASDSVIAPLFYFVLLGIPGAIGYRAINTLDAMIGFRGRYEALGKVAARLDDVVNWLPARLTAALLLLAGALLGKPVGQGWRICRRDAAATPSPNGGRPMAVIAGLLEVRLEKTGAYILGDARRPLTPAAARAAWRLVVVASLAMVGLGAGGLVAVGSGRPHDRIPVAILPRVPTPEQR